MSSNQNASQNFSPPLKLCYQGSVNRWECDENDHLNVRFYTEKTTQALQQYLLQENVVNSGDALRAPAYMSTQHMRFLQEARVATPLQIYCGVLQQTNRQISLLAVMQHAGTAQPLAAFVANLNLDFAQRVNFADSQNSHLMDLPSGFAPRGVSTKPMAEASLSASAALALGYQSIGMGVIQSGEADSDGMLPAAAMARLSDAMPNLWTLLQDASEAASFDRGDQGGAVLEYRFEYHLPLIPGYHYQILSAVKEIGNKTYRFGHGIYDSKTGRCALCAQATSVTMDLTTRRAMPISNVKRQQLNTFLVTTD